MDDLHKLRVLLATAAASFTDLTEKAWDYYRDPADVPLEAGGFLYLGRRKPFGTIYADVPVDYRNVTETRFTMEYWDDDAQAWTAYALPVEDTLALNRSGFIKWEPLIYAGSAAVWGETEVNGVTAFWVRLSVAESLTGITRVNAINIVFADDRDLQREEFAIRQLLPKDENQVLAESFILSHVAAREEILKVLRNRGNVKKVPGGTLEDIDEWDLFRSEQVREAAVFGAMAKIYFNASDSPEDIYWLKYKQYEGKFSEAMQLYLLSLDKNDDGRESTSEKNEVQRSGTFTRRA